MDDQHSQALAALERLNASLGFPHEAEQAAAGLEALGVRPPWLPEPDVQFYLGLARHRAGEPAAAEGALARVAPVSPCAPEAQWLLSRIYAARLTEDNAGEVRPQIDGCFRRIAERCPHCPLVQHVANVDSDRRQRELGPPVGPVDLPQVKVGTRYDREKLIEVAELFEQQQMFQEAAGAYGWTVEVRYPEEWLQAGVADAWAAVAECHAQRGERVLAARTLARSYALGLPAERIAEVSDRIRELLEPSESEAPKPEPDGDTLVQIGGLLAGMEMFDEALRVYRMARDLEADVALPMAAALEARAQFLFDYRAERSPAAMLRGAPLSWARVIQAWQEARAAYAQIDPPTNDSSAGTRRSDAAVARIQTLAEEGR